MTDAVSCVCLTYGRSWLLAEAIESFVRQDYLGPSELIIVNDFEGITLEVDQHKYGERIRIVNLPKRMKSLNDKFDLGVKLARYPLVCMWDDDDICLPHRITQNVIAWHEADKPDYISMSSHINYDIGKPATIVDRGIHGADMFTRDAYFAMDGSQGSGHNDQNFVAKMRADGVYRVHDNASNPSYIYRWGGITGHNSCYAQDLATCMRKFHNDVVRDPRFKLGRLHIVPAWSEDFVGIAAKVAWAS